MPTGRKPFRWTRINIAIRRALESGELTKQDVLEILTKDVKGRPSERAMTLGHYYTLVDDIARRIGLE